MSKPLSTFYDATKYLGQYIGQNIEFLRETSCMGPGEREDLALLEWLKTVIDDKKTVDFLDEIIIPLIKKMGYAHWIRDTVTDMALRKADYTEEETFEPRDATVPNPPEADTAPQ